MYNLIPKRSIQKLMSATLMAFLMIILSSVNALSFEVEITADPSPVEAFQEVEFSAVVTGGTAKSFLWEFGDGGKCKEQTCIHVYKRGGRSYTVKLTVVSDTGDTVTKTIDFEVEKRKEGCPTA